MSFLKLVILVALGLFLNLPEFADAHYPYTALECQQYGAFVHAIATSKDSGNDSEKTKQIALMTLKMHRERFSFMQDSADLKALMGSVDVVYKNTMTAELFSQDAQSTCMEMLVPKKEGL